VSTATRTRSIKLAIDSCLEDVFLLGLATRAICSYAPLNQLTTYQIETCVVEATNNCIKHAYQNLPGNSVEVVISLFIDRITFEVCDYGKAMETEDFEKQKRKELDYDPNVLEELPDGGMGLYIIRSVMDQVEYSSAGGKNVLTMTKRFENSERD